jgi:Putative restriction endonuclease
VIIPPGGRNRGNPAYAGRMRSWTDADLARLPEGLRYEELDGVLLVQQAPDETQRRLAEHVRAALSAAGPDGWRTLVETPVWLPTGRLVPDVVVLRPGTPVEPTAAAPADLALVVTVETRASHRIDRLVKPGLYAEAGVESYWRVECCHYGPVAHLYTGPRADRYGQHRCVHPGENVLAAYPFEVLVAPSTWTLP